MGEAATENADVKAAKKKIDDSNAVEKKELKLSDLKVTDLRNELESRGLDKTGVKAALVERLRKALQDEDKDPDEYLFEAPGDVTPTKKSRRLKEVANESKTESDADGNEAVDSDDDRQDSENAEVLQLSLDDKEIQFNDVKDGIDGQGKNSDIEEMDTKTGQSIEQHSSGEQDEEEMDQQVVSDAFDSEREGANEAKQAEETEKNKNDESKAAAAAVTKSKTAGKNAKGLVKSDKPNNVTIAKHLWITGLDSSTRAAQLKTLFGKHGKVISVKIVTNAKQVSGEKKYYGYITMATSKDAAKCIEAINNTELNGAVITVEKTQHQPGTLLRKTEVAAKKAKPATDVKKASVVSSKAKKDVAEPKDAKAAAREGSQEKDKDEKHADRTKSREREHRSRDSRDFRDYRRGSFRRPFGGYRGRGRGRGGYMFRERPPMENFRRPFGRKPYFGRMSYRPPMKPGFGFMKMREERMNRDHFREREMRESERRRAQETFRHKVIERKQREEAYRLEREKVQLRIEREMLERERAEILKLEREKQRIERERLEREKEKLRRQTQLRVSPKRPFPRNAGEADPAWEDKKRVARHYEGRYPQFHDKGPSMERRDYRDQPGYSGHKFEQRPERFDRDAHLANASRSEFKYAKEKPTEAQIRDHDERRVYKRSYYKEEGGRSYPPREAERYVSPNEDRGFKRKVHESMRSPRSRGGGRRMPYY